MIRGMLSGHDQLDLYPFTKLLIMAADLGTVFTSDVASLLGRSEKCSAICFTQTLFFNQRVLKLFVHVGYLS